MSNILIESKTIEDIADAIREKTKSDEKLYPHQMPEKIRSITTGNVINKNVLKSIDVEIKNNYKDKQLVVIKPYLSNMVIEESKNVLLEEPIIDAYAIPLHGDFKPGEITISNGGKIKDNKISIEISDPQYISAFNRDYFADLRNLSSLKPEIFKGQLQASFLLIFEKFITYTDHMFDNVPNVTEGLYPLDLSQYICLEKRLTWKNMCYSDNGEIKGYYINKVSDAMFSSTTKDLSIENEINQTDKNFELINLDLIASFYGDTQKRYSQRIFLNHKKSSFNTIDFTNFSNNSKINELNLRFESAYFNKINLKGLNNVALFVQTGTEIHLANIRKVILLENLIYHRDYGDEEALSSLASNINLEILDNKMELLVTKYRRRDVSFYDCVKKRFIDLINSGKLILRHFQTVVKFKNSDPERYFIALRRFEPYFTNANTLCGFTVITPLEPCLDIAVYTEKRVLHRKYITIGEEHYGKVIEIDVNDFTDEFTNDQTIVDIYERRILNTNDNNIIYCDEQTIFDLENYEHATDAPKVGDEYIYLALFNIGGINYLFKKVNKNVFLRVQDSSYRTANIVILLENKDDFDFLNLNKGIAPKFSTEESFVLGDVEFGDRKFKFYKETIEISKIPENINYACVYIKTNGERNKWYFDFDSNELNINLKITEGKY